MSMNFVPSGENRRILKNQLFSITASPIVRSGKHSNREVKNHESSVNDERNKDTRAFTSIISVSPKDCMFCFSSLQTFVGSSTFGSQICGRNEILLQNLVKKNLEKKYLTSREYYNSKVISDIIYNENTNIVSVFKDYLILDDISEFLKRFYSKNESTERLPKVIDFYEKYSKVFPNYIMLPESKIMFKNIERKQRHIDEQQRLTQKIQKEKADKEKKKNCYKSPHDYSIDLFNKNKMFNSTFLNSMAVLDEKSRIERIRKQASDAIEDVVELFFEKESETSNLMNTSDVSASIAITEQEDISLNINFNKPKIIPSIDNSLNNSNKKNETSQKRK